MPDSPLRRETTQDDFLRYQAARETIELFVLNLRTIRRGNLPIEAKARIREMVRLGLETMEILQRSLAGERRGVKTAAG
jgi:hypothetical protein